MNFIRPTISAKSALRVGAAAVLVGFSALILAVKGGELWAGFAAANGETALASAQALRRGPDREKALAQVQSTVSGGIQVSADNPRLWALFAETRLMQATADGVRNVSPQLLAAAEAAALKSIKLAPNDAAAHARLALAESLRGDIAFASKELTRSYELDSNSKAIGHRRIEVAGLIWRAVDERTKRDVQAEACTLASASVGDQTRVYNVRMTIAEPAFALAIDQILADPGCRPAQAAAQAEG